MEEALQIAREIVEKDYKEWHINAINIMRPCYKRTTKTITVEL